MAARNVADHPAQQIAAVLSRIYRRRLTTTSGGNLSIRDGKGRIPRIWITPAGLDKGALKPGDVVCSNPDGSCTGRHRPSSELPFHRAIYAARPDLKAIIHAHPPALVAFSIARQVPPTAILPEVYALCGRPAYVRYALTGSAELGGRIAAAFANGANCAILENHGVVVAADNMELAYQRFETLESAAEVALLAAGLGKVKTLSPRQLRQATVGLSAMASVGATASEEVAAGDNRVGRAVPARAHGRLLSTQQSRDALAVAPQLDKFLTRGREQGLLAIAGFGLSLRVSHDGFLVSAPALQSAGLRKKGTGVIISGPGAGENDSRPLFLRSTDTLGATASEFVASGDDRVGRAVSARAHGRLVSTRPSRDALAVAPQPAPGTAPWNWRLHQSIYRHHPRIGAAIVAAPVHAAAFAVTGTRLDARTIPESYLLLRQVATVAFKDWIDPQKLAAQVSLNQPALLLQNGGALVVGRTMLEAFDRLEVLESTASALIGALPLGGCRPMGARQVAELQAVFGTETKKEEESQRHEDAKTRRREK